MPFLIVPLLVAAAIGGGVSWEANQALPGDALYSFKVGINEYAQDLLARTDAAKAQVDVALAQTRLDEARQLAQKNKLNAATQSQLTQNFDARVADASARAATLSDEGDYKNAAVVATGLQAMLEREVALLQDASSQGSIARQASLVPMLVEARKMLAAASSASVSLSAKAVASNVTGI